MHIESYRCIQEITWPLISKYEELRTGKWPTGVKQHVRAKKATKGAKGTLSSKQELFAIKNSMYTGSRRLRRLRHSCCAPVKPTPSIFSAGFARHLPMMAFASTAWRSPIC